MNWSGLKDEWWEKTRRWDDGKCGGCETKNGARACSFYGVCVSVSVTRWTVRRGEGRRAYRRTGERAVGGG